MSRVRIKRDGTITLDGREVGDYLGWSMDRGAYGAMLDEAIPGFEPGLYTSDSASHLKICLREGKSQAVRKDAPFVLRPPSVGVGQ